MQIKKESRLGHKLDHWFWFIVLISPFLCYLAAIFNGVITVTFPQFMASNWWVSPTLVDTFEPIFTTLFGVSNIGSVFGWVVTVEILHCFVDVIAFIPRFCHQLIDYFC